MASLSAKRLAARNSEFLRNLHLIALAVNVSCLVSVLGFARPASIRLYLLLSIPALLCQWILERSGRPAVSRNGSHQKLLRAGEDIQGPGLYEYMIDCIYVTWASDILMIITGSNKAWYLFSVIPGFLIFQSFRLFKSLTARKQ